MDIVTEKKLAPLGFLPLKTLIAAHAGVLVKFEVTRKPSYDLLVCPD